METFINLVSIGNTEYINKGPIANNKRIKFNILAIKSK